MQQHREAAGGDDRTRDEHAVLMRDQVKHLGWGRDRAAALLQAEHPAHLDAGLLEKPGVPRDVEQPGHDQEVGRHHGHGGPEQHQVLPVVAAQDQPAQQHGEDHVDAGQLEYRGGAEHRAGQREPLPGRRLQRPLVEQQPEDHDQEERVLHVARSLDVEQPAIQHDGDEREQRHALAVDLLHQPEQQGQHDEGQDHAQHPGLRDARAGDGKPPGEHQEVERRLVQERVPLLAGHDVLIQRAMVQHVRGDAGVDVLVECPVRLGRQAPESQHGPGSQQRDESLPPAPEGALGHGLEFRGKRTTGVWLHDIHCIRCQTTKSPVLFDGIVVV